MARAPKPGPPTPCLRQLYADVQAYHAARPWDVLSDDELFGVEDPDTGEIAWCSVLGAAGELFGLAVYDGPEGFALYHAVMSDAASLEDTRMTQRGFLVAFGPRKLLEPFEVELLRTAPGGPPARDAWPMVRAMTPGYVPWVPDDPGCRRLSTILAQVLAAVASVRGSTGALAPDGRGRFVVRRREGAGEDSWVSARVEPEAPPRRSIPDFRDELRLRRVARLPQPRAAAWECDYSFAPIIVANGDHRPAYAAVVLIVDRASGAVLHAKLGPPPLAAAFLQEELIAAMEDARTRPHTVLARTAGVVAMLAPLASPARFTLEGPASVPALERAREALVEHMARRA
jgi:hypothetical protein